MSRYELRYFNRGRADKRAGLPPLNYRKRWTKYARAYMAGYAAERSCA